MSLWISIAALVLASISAVMFLRNLKWYVPPPRHLDRSSIPSVSVLIPARNEESNVADAIRATLASQDVDFEILIGDDNSEDHTAAIVQEFAAADSRVYLLRIPPLPAGWNGKEHACASLAAAAKYPVLCFVDADVRLAPDGLARMVHFLEHSGAALVSSIPRQQMETWLERLLIPLIHFVLLGYLPLERMRASTDPAYSAGCGQLVLTKAHAYHNAGGHASIRSSMHDGLKLTEAFRRAGYRTDLFDATPLASCRMYSNAAQVWQGLAKNATEGMATLARLPIFTVLLLGGHLLPFIALTWAIRQSHWLAAAFAAIAAVLSYLPRALAIRRFEQPAMSALLHPVGVSILVVIQWYAVALHLLGIRASWRGRAYHTRFASDRTSSSVEVRQTAK